jgi:cell division protein FtsQ
LRTAALTLRAVPRLALRLPRRVRLIAFLALLLAGALTAAYYGWFRDSSLVQVRDVSVVGLTGPDAPRLRGQLSEAAKQMTTLNVHDGPLREAVATEPSIRSLRVTPDFPHGLRIDVLENHPVAAIQVPGSGVVPIAGNGVLMPDARASGSVPELRPGVSPRIGRDSGAPARLADDRAEQLVRIAGTAPPALLRRALTIERRPGQGIVVTFRNGPPVIFGDDSRSADKWLATAGVLASRDAQGATYVDVRLPDRPVAGGLKPPILQSSAATGTATVAPPAVATTPSTPTGGSSPAQATTAPATPASTQAGTSPTTAGTTSTNTQP